MKTKPFGKALYGSLCALSLWSALPASAWDENILISIDNNSLVLSGNYGEEPRFSHFGPAIKEADLGAMHDIWAGMNRPAYPVFGTEYNTLTSLQLVHADGNPTTYLALEKIDRKETPRGEPADSPLLHERTGSEPQLPFT